MANTQIQTAIDILKLLLENLEYLESKWLIYQNNGYLFKTSTFNKSSKYIKNSIFKMENTKNTINNIFNDLDSKYENPTTVLEDAFWSENRDDFKSRISNYRSPKKSKIINFTQEERDILLKESFENIDLSNFDNFSYLYNIGNIILNSYTNIEDISDLINALDHNFRKRLIGIDTTEIGTELDSRSFGNIQIIYNAAETLMYDYTESINSDFKYEGQVVFGFRNRAAGYPLCDVVVIPSYAEFYLEYLSVLAHEAFHFIENQKDEYVLKTINQIKEDLKNILNVYSLNWDDDDINIKIKDKITNKIASEILADVYGICVGGDAYYSTLKKFYMPLLFDLNVEETEIDLISEYLHSQFSISSLRARISNSVYNDIFGTYNKKYNYKTELKFIEQWENLSINTNRYYILKNKTYTKEHTDKLLEMLKVNSEHIKVIEDQLLEKQIYSRLYNLINDKYFDGDNIQLIADNLYSIDTEGTVIHLLSGTPSINELNNIWKQNSWLKPRHILSMYVLNKKKINRNAVLFVLGNHQYIKDRYKMKDISKKSRYKKKRQRHTKYS